MADIMVKLPTKEEMEEWIEASFSHLNQDVVPFLLMGVEALYVKLGGEKFITITNKDKATF